MDMLTQRSMSGSFSARINRKPIKRKQRRHSVNQYAQQVLVPLSSKPFQSLTTFLYCVSCKSSSKMFVKRSMKSTTKTVSRRNKSVFSVPCFSACEKTNGSANSAEACSVAASRMMSVACPYLCAAKADSRRTRAPPPKITACRSSSRRCNPWKR